MTFHGISGLGVAEGIFLSWGLKPKAVEHAEEAAGEVAVEHEPVRWTKRVSGVGHELTRGLRIASVEPEIALAYFSGFAVS